MPVDISRGDRLTISNVAFGFVRLNLEVVDIAMLLLDEMIYNCFSGLQGNDVLSASAVRGHDP